jgi:hypothetical protein
MFKKISLERVKTYVMAAFFILYAVSAFAGSDDQIALVMQYVKWIVGVVAGIVTVSSVGFLMWGLHLKNQGDPKGNDMVKNALWTIVICAVAFALLGALIFKGKELGTGVNNIEKGWQ